MVVAKIYVDGTRAIVTSLSSITMGMQGAQVEVEYNGIWSGLNRTAVFAGSVVKDIVNAGELLTIPAELTEKPRHQLRIGFYGVDGDGKVVIPTLWATLGIVQDATDPSGDTSTDPSLPVWAQLLKMYDELQAGAVPPETIKKAVEEYLTENPIDDLEIPEALPNPHKLTFTGAVQAEYDGSSAVTVEIPNGHSAEVPESEMVLIERFTVDEEAIKIERNMEPDGTPYNFSAVTIRAKFPPSAKKGNLAIFFTFRWPAEIRSYMISPYNEAAERSGYSKCYLSNGRWRSGWWTCVLGGGDFAQYYENPVQQEQFGIEDGYLSKISLTHTEGIEAGSTFEIWGVRANA